ncbi:hypothetical protein J2S09_000454 [Bacillus fengqiuensis]|nr:hypothetical protein [Bacillus fengqiuensis]
MEDKTKIRLTSAEMSSLWSQYMSDTASICVMSYFLAKVEDEEVRPIVEYALNSSKGSIAFLQDFFRKESFPVPVGFTEQDVDITAPRLFSDTYMLMYLRSMSILGMAASSAALGLVTRSDLLDFHKRVFKSAVMLQDLSRELMLKQGTYVRPPFVSIPDKVDFVEKQHFLAGFLGEKRPLTTIEVTHLFMNVQTNAVGKTLMIGFAQTAQKPEVKQFLVRGKQIAQKHMNFFSDILMKEDLPAPMSWDTAVSDSTTKVFSDKLIMFHVSVMIAAGIGNYGTAMAASPRRDLGMRYASLIPEISLYAEDGANIMIKHGWLEEPPQADDRNRLAKG